MSQTQQLILTSASGRPLRPLIEDALRRELAILEAGLRRTQQRLRDFETRYGIATDAFLQGIQNGTLDETLDTIEWVGEQRLFERISEKINTLQEIKLAD